MRILPILINQYDNPLFVPTIDMHDNEEFRLESLYDNALDDGPMLLDVTNYNATENGIGEVSTLARRSPYILRVINHLAIQLLKVGWKRS